MERPQTGTDATPADSSPAPVRAEAVIESLSHEERTSWEQSGDLPDRIAVTSSKSDAPAASSPATPDRPAASTDARATPASEPGQPVKEKGAKARSAELDADIAGLQERLKLRRALREELASTERTPDVKAPAPSPGTAPTTAEYERFLAMPTAPREEDFDSYTKFTAALSVFIADQRQSEHQARASADAGQRAREDGLRQMGEAATSRIQDYAKSDPEFDSKISSELLDVPTASFLRLQGKEPGPQHVLAEEVLKSDHVGPLLVHFSTDAGKAEWGSLCRLSHPDLLKAFGRVEARFEGTDRPATPLKLVSGAAAPPTVLGQRPADTADRLEQAVKRKDMDAYVREANTRELAAMKR